MTPTAHQYRPHFRDTHSDFGRKAHICGEVLNEARRQLATGRVDGALRQLMARLCELLDDLNDESLRKPLTINFPR
jgi:hypothetical protein